MIITLKSLNEVRYVNRCIGDFHDLPFVDKVIVVDGDSSDFTVQELKQFPKVEVHVHKWLQDYHYQECIQSNILLSYVPNGQIFMIMDFDERMSDDLKKELQRINDDPSSVIEGCLYHFSRLTQEVIRYEDSPFAVLGEDGWPEPLNKIGSYPDYQGRLMKKDPTFHWTNSPHHVGCGHKSQVFIDADILHFQRDDIRFRIDREKQWLYNQAERKRWGLTADVFECKPNLDLIKYADPETWK